MSLLKHKKIFFISLLGWLLFMAPVAPKVSAAPIPAGCPGGSHEASGTGHGCPDSKNVTTGNTLHFFSKLNFDGECKKSSNPEDCGITSYLVVLIRLLSGVVGIVVLIMIAWGGLQYTTSRDNPQQTAAAKDHIRNALFALIFYIFSIALINYLVPGGVF